MVTPFSDDLKQIDVKALENLARYLVELGHDLIVCNGTTGESATTTDEEKHLVVKTVKETVGEEVTVLTSAGSNNTAHAIKLAKEAEQNGYADGLLLVTPYYNKPSQSGLLNHTLAVAEATELPIMLYDIPSRAGIEIEFETAKQLAQHPKIVALKEAKSNLHEGSKLIQETKLEIYSGEDALNFPWLCVGGVGIVSVTSHLTGSLDRLMIDALRSGDIALARKLHLQRTSLVDAIMNQGPGVEAVKYALKQRGVLENSNCRLPLTEVNTAVASQIDQALLHLKQIEENYSN